MIYCWGIHLSYGCVNRPLYMSALQENPELSMQLLNCDGFTDIEFNPKKALNCQAASAARYVAAVRRGLLEQMMSTPETFLIAKWLVGLRDAFVKPLEITDQGMIPLETLSTSVVALNPASVNVIVAFSGPPA